MILCTFWSRTIGLEQGFFNERCEGKFTRDLSFKTTAVDSADCHWQGCDALAAILRNVCPVMRYRRKARRFPSARQESGVDAALALWFREKMSALFTIPDSSIWLFVKQRPPISAWTPCVSLSSDFV
jgi:hypothetical protein